MNLKLTFANLSIGGFSKRIEKWTSDVHLDFQAPNDRGYFYLLVSTYFLFMMCFDSHCDATLLI